MAIFYVPNLCIKNSVLKRCSEFNINGSISQSGEISGKS